MLLPCGGSAGVLYLGCACKHPLLGLIDPAHDQRYVACRPGRLALCAGHSLCAPLTTQPWPQGLLSQSLCPWPPPPPATSFESSRTVSVLGLSALLAPTGHGIGVNALLTRLTWSSRNVQPIWVPPCTVMFDCTCDCLMASSCHRGAGQAGARALLRQHELFLGVLRQEDLGGGESCAARLNPRFTPVRALLPNRTPHPHLSARSTPNLSGSSPIPCAHHTRTPSSWTTGPSTPATQWTRASFLWSSSTSTTRPLTSCGRW